VGSFSFPLVSRLVSAGADGILNLADGILNLGVDGTLEYPPSRSSS
jgi:hypothetical protein